MDLFFISPEPKDSSDVLHESSLTSAESPKTDKLTDSDDDLVGVTNDFEED